MATICGDGEVAQTLTSATSEWGLCREAQAASLVRRVRTGPECPEDNMRSSHEIAIQTMGWPERQKNKKTPFPRKALTLHGDPWRAHPTQDCANTRREYQKPNTKGEQASCHTGPSISGRREGGTQQPEPEGKGLFRPWPQSPHLPPNCEQGPRC